MRVVGPQGPLPQAGRLRRGVRVEGRLTDLTGLRPRSRTRSPRASTASRRDRVRSRVVRRPHGRCNRVTARSSPCQKRCDRAASSRSRRGRRTPSSTESLQSRTGARNARLRPSRTRRAVGVLGNGVVIAYARMGSRGRRCPHPDRRAPDAGSSNSATDRARPRARTHSTSTASPYERRAGGRRSRNRSGRSRRRRGASDEWSVRVRRRRAERATSGCAEPRSRASTLPTI